jgi:hypothetical protein
VSHTDGLYGLAMAFALRAETCMHHTMHRLDSTIVAVQVYASFELPLGASSARATCIQ